MGYLSSMLVILALGTCSLMLGIIIDKEPGQSFQSVSGDSVVWGLGFLLSFGSEFLVLVNS